MKLITRSKGKERVCMTWASLNINIEKYRETMKFQILVEFFVLVDNKTYIEFGKVRYRNYLVLLDDI